jgi:DNA-binding response OmpR family regulator
MRIALLEEYPDHAAAMIRTLTTAGHVCHEFSNGMGLLHALRRQSFDLLILDWASDMPGGDLLRSVLEGSRQYVPVIFVSARSHEYDVTSILNAGADDYIVKPVSDAVLLARVCALLRRVYKIDRTVTQMTFGDFVFDLASDGVMRRGIPLELKKREFELALLLFQNLGRPLSRVHISEIVWKQAADIPSRTMDTHISLVRTKLGLRPENGYRLAPVYGYGYRLEQIACDPVGRWLERHCDAAPPARH